jgi:hypothetical protein
MLLGIVRSTSIPNNIHITLVMLALAFLVSLCVQQQHGMALDGDGAPRAAAEAGTHDLVPLSVPEARQLLAALLFPRPSRVALVIAWSAWRRRHQWRACFFHTRHRLKAG